MKMKKYTLNARKKRTRTLIQLGGLVQKSGLMDILNIQIGEDLQDYESIFKASQVLGFLSESVEKCEVNESITQLWEKTGERLLRYGES